MTSFDEREKAQENKYAHDEELNFKAHARAAKLFGEWSAAMLGLPPGPYAAELVNLVSGGKAVGEVIKKVRADAQGRGQQLSADLLEEKFNRCLSEAKDYILKS